MDKFSKVLVSVAAASVLASGAMASGLVFSITGDKNPTEPVTIDDVNGTIVKDLSKLDSDYKKAVQIDELLKGSSIEVNVTDSTGWPGSGDKYNRFLAYWSSSKLALESTLRFKINCGEIDDSTEIKLYAIEDNDTNLSNGGFSFVQVGFLEDFVPGTSGYKEILMKVNSNIERSGDKNFITYDGKLADTNDTDDGKIPANVALFFASDANASQLKKLVFIPKKGDSCGCVCDTTVEMTDAQNKNGQKLYAPLTKDKPTILTYAPGFSATVQHREKNMNGQYQNGYATSVINTTKGIDRKQFVDENLTNGKGDTSLLKSSFKILLKNEAEYGLDLLDDDKDTFTLNVNRAIGCAVDKVTLSTKTGAKKTVDLTKDTTVSKPSFDLKDAKFKDYNLTDENNITISVNGKDVICPGMWRVSLTINPSEVDGSIKVLDVANAADWRIKAMQFIIPYLNTDPNYGTYLVITNMGDAPADVLFDAYGDSGKNEGAPTSAYYTNIKLSPIPKRSTRIYFPKDINAAIKAKFPAWNANRYMAKFYVLADENNIEAAAFQKDGNNGKRSIPVLTQAYHWEGNSTTGSYEGHKFHE